MSKIVVRAPKRNREVRSAAPVCLQDLKPQQPEPRHSSALEQVGHPTSLFPDRDRDKSAVHQSETWEDSNGDSNEDGGGGAEGEGARDGGNISEDRPGVRFRIQAGDIRSGSSPTLVPPAQSSLNSHPMQVDGGGAPKPESPSLSLFDSLLADQHSLALETPAAFQKYEAQQPRGLWGLMDDNTITIAPYRSAGAPAGQHTYQYQEPEPEVRRLAIPALQDLLHRDPVHKVALEVEASFDLSPLVRAVEQGAPVSTDEAARVAWSAWIDAPCAQCFPAPPLLLPLHAGAGPWRTGDSNSAATSPRASASASNAVSTQSAMQSGIRLQAEALAWTQAVADAWKRVRANNGSLQYFTLRSPHTNPYTVHGEWDSAAARAPPTPTLGALFCSVAYRSTLTKSAAPSVSAVSETRSVSSAHKAKGERDVEPLCVLTGVNSQLLLRLQELGAAPRVATVPGAVLPGVYMSSELDDSSGIGTAISVPSVPQKQLSMVQKQQQQKEAAEKALRIQTEAVAAIAAHGHTVLVLGVGEIGIVVDVLCEAMLAAVTPIDAPALNGVGQSTVRLYTQSTKRGMVRGRVPHGIPHIVAPQPFLHSVRAPLQLAHASAAIPESAQPARVTLVGDVLPAAVTGLCQLLQYLASQEATAVTYAKKFEEEARYRDNRVYRRSELLRRRALAVSATGTRSTIVPGSAASGGEGDDFSAYADANASASASAGAGVPLAARAAGSAGFTSGTLSNPMRIFSSKLDLGNVELAAEGSAGTAGRLERRLAPGGRPHYGGGALLPPVLTLQQRVFQWLEDDADEGGEHPAHGASFFVRLQASDGQDGFRMASLCQLHSCSQLRAVTSQHLLSATDALQLQQFGVVGAAARSWGTHTVHDVFWWGGGANNGHAEVDATTAQPPAVELHPVSVLAHAAAREVALSNDAKGDLGHIEQKGASPSPTNPSKYRSSAGLTKGGYRFDYSDGAELQGHVDGGYAYGTRGGAAPHKDAVLVLKALKPYTPYAA